MPVMSLYRQAFRQSWLSALLALLLLGAGVEQASARALLVKAEGVTQALEGSRTARVEAQVEAVSYAAVQVPVVPLQVSVSEAQVPAFERDAASTRDGVRATTGLLHGAERPGVLPPFPLGARWRALLQVYRC